MRKPWSHDGGQAMVAAPRHDGLGLVVQNVAWGPRGAGTVAARLIGLGVRLAVLLMGSQCMISEIEGWQEMGYALPLQCLLVVVCSMGGGATLWLMATSPCQVGAEDVLAVPLQEAVTWTWCSYCRLLRPPASMHCLLCHRCIVDIHHHCVVLWRCIGRKSLPTFILSLAAFVAVILINFVMIKEATITLRGFILNYFIPLPVLILLAHSIYSLKDPHKPAWRPLQVYPSSAFVVRAPHKVSSVAPFTFSFSGIPSKPNELLKMTFRPLAAWKNSPKTAKVRHIPRCPNKKCRALGNPYWLIGDPDGKLQCNLCKAFLRLPGSSKGSPLDHSLLAERDVQCLVRNDQPHKRPRLIFVLDSSVSDDVRECIHSWATAAHGLPDVKVLCYKTRSCCLYSNEKVQEEAEKKCHSLGTLVQRAWKDVATHGGRMVFIRSQEKYCIEEDVLEELVRAASLVTLNMVSVSRLGVHMNPMLHPLILHHQAQNGGSTRLLEHSSDVLKLVKSGIFLFWGVMAHGRVQWTPGIHVEKVHVKGVASLPSDSPGTFSGVASLPSDSLGAFSGVASLPSDSPGAFSGVASLPRDSPGAFSMACLDQEKQVEFSLKVDPGKVFSDPMDDTVFFQLQMLYTNVKGKMALSVFNRVFTIADGLHDTQAHPSL